MRKLTKLNVLKLSDLTLQYKGRAELKNLECQKLKNFYIKSKQQCLPDDWVSYTFTHEADASKDIINVIRATGLLEGHDILTWSGVGALVSTAYLDQKIVGFL